MTEFQRLSETSPNPLTRELLEAGLRDRAPAHGADRALLALGISAGISVQASAAGAAGAVGTAAGTAGAVGTAVGTASTGSALLAPAVLTKLFVLGLAGGVAVSGGATWVRHEVARPAPVSSAHGAAPQRAVESRGPAPRRAQEPPSPLALSPTEVRDETAPVATAPSEPAPSRAGTVTSGTAGPGAFAGAAQRPPLTNQPELPASVLALPSEGGALAREVELIDRARSSLKTGAAAGALAELELYERERVTGTLDREALLIRIDALVLLGEHSRAAELARSYLARFPKDAHATRLRAVAEGR